MTIVLLLYPSKNSDYGRFRFKKFPEDATVPDQAYGRAPGHKLSGCWDLFITPYEHRLLRPAL